MTKDTTLAFALLVIVYFIPLAFPSVNQHVITQAMLLVLGFMLVLVGESEARK